MNILKTLIVSASALAILVFAVPQGAKSISIKGIKKPTFGKQKAAARPITGQEKWNKEYDSSVDNFTRVTYDIEQKLNLMEKTPYEGFFKNSTLDSHRAELTKLKERRDNAKFVRSESRDTAVTSYDLVDMNTLRNDAQKALIDLGDLIREYNREEKNNPITINRIWVEDVINQYRTEQLKGIF